MGLFDAFSADSNRQLARQTANQQEAAINKGKTQGRQDINKGMAKGAVPLNQASAGFAPFQQNGVLGSNALTSGLGLNGQAGYDATVGAFHNGPGFQFALDQANQNVLRNQAQTGALNSGNTLTALSDRAQGLQNQEYGSWLDRLQGLSGQGLQGAAGQAQALSNLSNLFQTGYENKANIATGAASNLANIYGQQGQNLASANNTANTNAWGAILGLGNAGAQLGGTQAKGTLAGHLFGIG